MKHLWSPCRMKFIKNFDKQRAKGCVFCNALKSKQDKKNLVVYRGKTAFIILNLYPYNNGHLMVVPNKHVSDLFKLSRTELTELMELSRTAIAALNKEFRAQGYNLGMNLGKAAGAGIDDHLHIHIVPRWNGDTNFMPVTANTKVMPELLSSVYEKLLKGLNK